MRDRRVAFREAYSVDFWVNFPEANDFSSFFQYLGAKASSLHGSTPPAMGELPALPCASAVGDASPAEGSKGLLPAHRKGILRIL